MVHSKTIPLSSGYLKDLVKWNSLLWNSLGADEIIFDFESVRFITPMAMVFIAHQTRNFRRECKWAEIRSSNFGHLGYAISMGLFSSISFETPIQEGSGSGDINYLPVTLLSVSEFISQNGPSHLNEAVDIEATRLARVLTRLGSGYTYDAVQYSLREIIRNVFEHSGSRSLMYAAQYWPTKRKVTLVIADEGMGIRESLSNNPKFRDVTDRDSLHFACMPGVSGNYRALQGLGRDTIWRNSGYGLYMTSRLCRNSGGFQIISSNRALVLGDSIKTDFAIQNFKGTLIRLDLETRSETSFKSRLEKYAEEGKEFAKTIAGAKILDASTASLMLSRDFKRGGA